MLPINLLMQLHRASIEELNPRKKFRPRSIKKSESTDLTKKDSDRKHRTNKSALEVPSKPGSKCATHTLRTDSAIDGKSPEPDSARKSKQSTHPKSPCIEYQIESQRKPILKKTVKTKPNLTDLINHQQAEITRLKVQLRALNVLHQAEQEVAVETKQDVKMVQSDPLN